MKLEKEAELSAVWKWSGVCCKPWDTITGYFLLRQSLPL